MEQIKKTVRAGRIGPGVTDQFYVDEDINIPEAKYDAARVVYSSGRIHVEDIRPAEHYARVTGRLSYQILYETEDGGGQLSSLAGRLPFEEMVYMEEEPKDQLFVRGATAEVSVTLINSRKMNLKASVDLTIGSEGAEEEQITARGRSWNCARYRKMCTASRRRSICRQPGKISAPSFWGRAPFGNWIPGWKMGDWCCGASCRSSVSMSPRI